MATTPWRKVFLIWSKAGVHFLGLAEEAHVLPYIRQWAQQNKTPVPNPSDAEEIWEKLASGAMPIMIHGTPFQEEVWRALCNVQLGTVATYQDLAKEIGNPKASRAVGSALGKNPVSLIIPCHRIIRNDGTVGQYLWGVHIKKELLRHEGIHFS